jgi:hypothetical protein
MVRQIQTVELEKKYNIQDNFIGIFDNFFSNELIKII